MELTCVDSIWRVAVDVTNSVLTLTAGVKDQNGFVLFAPSMMRLNVNRNGILADGRTVAEFLDSIT